MGQGLRWEAGKSLHFGGANRYLSISRPVAEFVEERVLDPGGGTDLADYLRGLKEGSGRSYEALARQLHVSRSALHRYCSGAGAVPTLSLVEQFARECGAKNAELAEARRRWLLAENERLNGTAPLGVPAQAVRALTVRQHGTAEPATSHQLSGTPAFGREPVSIPASGGASPVPASPVPNSAAVTVPPTEPAPALAPARRSSPRRRLLIGLSALVVALTAGLIWQVTQPTRAETTQAGTPVRREVGPTTSASASDLSVPAGTCVARQDVEHTDARRDGRIWNADYLCGNDIGAPLYQNPESPTKIAEMETSTSWFICWTSDIRSTFSLLSICTR